MAKHEELTKNHVPYRWSYADQTAREAATGFVPGDVGKLARQVAGTPSNSLWMLTDDDPPTWAAVAAGAEGGGNATSTSAYASPPVSPAEGDLWMPSDGFSIFRYSGAAWVSWGPVYPLTKPPVLSNWAWINQGSASAADSVGGIYLADAATAAFNNRVLKRAVPGSTYKVTAGFFATQLMPAQYHSLGMCWRQSSDGKMVTFGPSYNTTSGLGIIKCTVSAYAAAYVTDYVTWIKPNLWWLRMEVDSTNRICSYSHDGIHFVPIHTVAKTDYLSPDEIGIYVRSENGTYPIGMQLISWKEE